MGQSTNAQETISKRIRFLMQTRSMTMGDLAQRIGVTREHMRYVLDGLSWPTKHLLEKICVTFDVKMDYFGPNLDELLGGTVISTTDFIDPTAGDEEASASGQGSQGSQGGQAEKKSKRKFDLAEMAAHHQALLEALVEKKILRPGEYEKKLKDVRARAGLD